MLERMIGASVYSYVELSCSLELGAWSLELEVVVTKPLKFNYDL